MRTKRWLILPLVAFVCICCQPEEVRAQRAQAARAAAEFIIERFGRPAAREGVEVLARRIESAAARYGEEAIVAARKCGPQLFKAVEAAGASGGNAVRIMATHGEPGVAWVLKRPTAMKLLVQHGEEAAAVLVRHPGGIAEPVIEGFGGPAVKALQAVGPQGGRRLAMMLSDGELAKIGRTPEVLIVVAQYGDRALEFVYKHRLVLAGGAALTAFLVNPEPFLNGARDITKIAAENVIRPIAEVPGKVAEHAASRINWTLMVLIGLLVMAGAGIAAGIATLNPWCRHLVRLWLSGTGGLGGFILRGSVPASPPAAVPSPESTCELPKSRPPLRRGVMGHEQ